MNGYYTICQNTFFDDGTSLLLHFTHVSDISSNCINEKLAMKVKAIDLIKKQTTISGLQIHTLPLPEANPLGLASFTLMGLVESFNPKTTFYTRERERKETFRLVWCRVYFCTDV